MKNSIIKTHLTKLLLSKNLLKNILTVPRISSLRIFFMLNLKIYFKGSVIFYILISVIYTKFLITKKVSLKAFVLFEISVNKKYFLSTLVDFCKIFLPQYAGYIFKQEFKYKIFNNAENHFVLSLYYFSFPIIHELFKLLNQIGVTLNNFFNNIKMEIECGFQNVLNSVSIKNGFLLNYFKMPCMRFFKK